MANQTNTPDSKVGLLSEILRSGRLAWRLLSDPRVPTINKLVIPGLVGLYLLWPGDLMPDFLPVLGQLDDLALLALAIKLFIDLSPADIVRQHRDGMTPRGPSSPEGDAAKEVVDAEYRVVE